MGQPTASDLADVGNMRSEVGQLAPDHVFQAAPSDPYYCAACEWPRVRHNVTTPDGYVRAQRPKPKHTLEERARRATLALLDDEHLGEVLRGHFPEARTGDESPDMAIALETAVYEYVSAWAGYNARPPLTLTEAVAALVEARNTLRDVAEHDACHGNARNDPANHYADARATITAIQAALDRAPFTEDELPRP